MKTPTKKPRSWPLILFALPFAGVGSFMGYLIVSSVCERIAINSWSPMQASIESVSLEEHDGDDTTTYEVVAQFHFEFNGVRYRGSRVALHQGADNLGSYHEDKYRYLDNCRRREQQVPGWVNPNDPTDSILFAELRFTRLGLYALITLIFGGVGYGLLFGNGMAVRNQRRQTQQQLAHPDEPWLWEQQWSDGRVLSNSKRDFLGSALMALFWNAVSAPILFVLPEELADGNHLAWIGMLFPAIGVGLAAWAFRNTLRWLKYRNTAFEMQSVPGVLGGALGGVITTPVGLQPEDGYRLRLLCQRSRTTGSGDDRSTHKSTLWESTHILDRQLLEGDPNGSAIPVYFEIPYDCLATDTEDNDNKVEWFLDCSAEVPGVDFQVRFHVPVFKTEQSATEFQGHDPLTAYRREPTAVADTSAPQHPSRILILETANGGVEVHYPRARNLGVNLVTTLFFLAWSAACYGLWQSDAPAIFPWAFSALDAILAIAVFNCWLKDVVVTVDADGLSIVSSWILYSTRRQIAAAQIEDFRNSVGMHSNNRQWYRIETRIVGRSVPVVAGSSIPNKSEADRIVTLMHSALGREHSSQEYAAHRSTATSPS